ncbi:SDR family NAD(P)-dependent oxidoreductase [Glycomyces luteolus]|uniref:SDR family NAD(P)-dependent oxidoreductase n=1 Tax=Glycomyces luteolus TaxID=2670330 RepID=A0A9X3PC19_9ACTN|nr:type I polyketide synthase [Glycomyces luteolus]MDA1360932.1 SDR family NAD(P)-dependent oxidoreductase [Glycomyces luteolus]
MPHKLARTPVAVVGVAGVFPDAPNVGEFWNNILAGKDSIAEVPESHWRAEDYYDADPLAADRTYARRGSFLSAETFDPLEFGITPRSVDSIGLVQLLSLNVARDVLRDAGCAGAPWFDPARTGVILGVCGANSTGSPLLARLQGPDIERAAADAGLAPQDAAELSRRYLASLPQWTPESFPGLLGNVVSGRIAKHFSLGAANATVDAACASSLAALRTAVDELVLGRADLMLTGGCDVDNSVFAFMCFSKTPALSPSGRIRPFDAAADGTLIGEGIGMLALKRLADAERDGDRVYAVIRGIGNSSDGPATSIYAPCGEGQALALKRAYDDAEVPAASVSLIEAHGTGTPTGDKVELAALNRCLDGARPRSVAVGSVKSQIGHTKAAAGAAGLIKMALALHDRILPPHINVDEPCEEARRPDAPIYISGAARPWIKEPQRPVRRGGVSSFGFGGVNYHVVLEEHEGVSGPGRRAARSVPKACLWHAPDPAALLDLLLSGAPGDPAAPIPADHARIGFTSADEREYEALLAAAVEGLRDHAGIDEWARDGVYCRRRAMAHGTRIAALFTGQGSQYPDMGRDAVSAFPPVRDAFDRAALICPDSPSLPEVVFPLPGTDRDTANERLRRTEYAQPAIGALAMGQYHYLTELGFAPDTSLGHSFGELTALWAAGGLDDEDFLRLAAARGRAMAAPASTDPGAMAAVRCTEDRLSPILSAHPDVAVCNRNAPDELVVGGPTNAVEQMIADCSTRGVHAKALPVAAAFHTGLVAHAVGAFAEATATATFRPPVHRVLAGAPGAAYGEDADANRSTLTSQITQPVDFQRRIEELHETGHRVFVEFGPRGVLSGLVERILPGTDITVLPTDIGPQRDGAAALKEAAVRLAVLGVPLGDLNRYDPLPAEQPALSPVARSLCGPNFAVNAVRDALEPAAQPATPVRQGPAPAVRPDRPAVPRPAAEPDGAGLAQIATEHLELHNRYMDGQLRTARELTGIARVAADRGSSAAREIEAIRDHGIALGRAHALANEVFRELVGLDSGPLRTDSTSAAEPFAQTPAAPIVQPTPPAQPEPEPADVDRAADLADIEQLIRETIADKTGFPLSMIGLDQDIQVDLGIDSLTQVEIAAELWRHYPDTPRESLYRLSTGRTVGDFVDLSRAMLTETSTRPPVRTNRVLPLGRAHVALRELPDSDYRVDAYRPEPTALVVDDGGAVAAAVIEALEHSGWRTTVLALPGVSPDRSTPWRGLEGWSEPALAGALSELIADDGILDLAVIALTEIGTVADAIRRLSHTLLVAKGLQPALESGAAGGTRAALVTVTALDGALGYAGSRGRPERALTGGVGGLIRTVALETNGLFCRSLDYAPELAAEHVAERLLREIADAATDLREVGDDGTARCTPMLSETPQPLLPPTPVETAEVTEDDLFVVTGGARGVTSWCVIETARRYRCGFLLLGRTTLSGGADSSPEEREIETTLQTLRALGVRAEYLAADVTDASAVAAALAPYTADITGVIHGAGVLADQWLKDKTAETVARVVGPKLTGLDAVIGAVDAERLRHLVVFSSVAGLNGNLRQSDYAMSNEALNRFACAWKAGRPACRVSAIAFGPWTGGMANAAIRAIYAQQGIPLLTRENGASLFVEQLGAEHQDHLVTVLGPTVPLFQSFERLTPPGATVRRDLSRLGSHPVLRDHAFDKRTPVLPASAAIGWCAHALEGLHGGQPVVEARDVRIGRGLVFDGSEHDRFELEAAPSGDGDWVDIAIRSHPASGPSVLRYRGRFRTAAEPTEPPRMDGLDSYELPPFEPHPYYAEGFLFHGPVLTGLGPELAVGPDRVVVMARLAAPSLPGFNGRWYNGASADLLPQGALLLERRLTGRRSLPLTIDAVEMYAPLPDDRPFLIVADLDEQRALDTRYTVSACTADGRILQRWRGLAMLTVTPEMLADSKWVQVSGLVEQEQAFGTGHHA